MAIARTDLLIRLRDVMGDWKGDVTSSLTGLTRRLDTMARQLERLTSALAARAENVSTVAEARALLAAKPDESAETYPALAEAAETGAVREELRGAMERLSKAVESWTSETVHVHEALSTQIGVANDQFEMLRALLGREDSEALPSDAGETNGSMASAEALVPNAWSLDQISVPEPAVESDAVAGDTSILESEIEALRASNDALARQVEDAERETAQARAEATSIGEHAAALQSELDALGTTNAGARADLLAEVRELRTQLAGAEALRKASVAEVADAYRAQTSDQIDALVVAMASRRHADAEQLAAFEQGLADAQAAYAAQREASSKALHERDDAIASEREARLSVEAERDSARAACDAERAVSASLREQVAHVQQALQDLRLYAVTQEDALHAAREAASDAQAQLEQAGTIGAADRAALEANADHLRELEAMLEQQTAEFEQLRATFADALSRARAVASEREARIGDLDQSLDTAHAELSAAREHLAALEGEARSREQELDALRTKSAEREALIAEHTVAIDALRDEHRDTASAYEQVVRRGEDLEAALERAGKELASLREAHDGLLVDRSELQSHLDRAQGDAALSNTQIASLTESLASTKNEREAQSARALALQSQLEQAQAESCALHAELSRVAERMNEAVLAREHLVEELRVAKSAPPQAAPSRAERLPTDQEHLHSALIVSERAAGPGPRRIGEMLQRAGAVTERQIDAAIALQEREPNLRLGEALVRSGAITEAALAQALACQTRLSWVVPRGASIQRDAAMLVARRVCTERGVVPLRREGRRLVVAMADPLDVDTISLLALESGCDVTPVVATRSDIEDSIVAVYTNFQ